MEPSSSGISVCAACAHARRCVRGWTGRHAIPTGSAHLHYDGRAHDGQNGASKADLLMVRDSRQRGSRPLGHATGHAPPSGSTPG
jgi:hypothetical protein